MIKDLFFETLKITEKTAIACAKIIGNQNQHQADFVAVDAMRAMLNQANFFGKIVIGEGERDQAPMLYINEQVGKKNYAEVDIAVDPLEGTKLCAYNKRGAMSVIAIGEKGTILHAPDVYMEKIAVGPSTPTGVVDLDESIETNLKNLAKFHKKNITDLNITVLKRSRHKELIMQIKSCGAKLKLISDGDIAAAISTSYGKNRSDLYVGIGGAPEGVLAAAALKAVGGNISGRLIFENSEQILRAKSMGIKNPNQKLSTLDMVKGDVIFASTAITNNEFIKGLKFYGKNIITETFITSTSTKMALIVKNEHL